MYPPKAGNNGKGKKTPATEDSILEVSDVEAETKQQAAVVKVSQQCHQCQQCKDKICVDLIAV